MPLGPLQPGLTCHCVLTPAQGLSAQGCSGGDWLQMTPGLGAPRRLATSCGLRGPYAAAPCWAHAYCAPSHGNFMRTLGTDIRLVTWPDLPCSSSATALQRGGGGLCFHISFYWTEESPEAQERHWRTLFSSGDGLSPESSLGHLNGSSVNRPNPQSLDCKHSVLPKRAYTWSLPQAISLLALCGDKKSWNELWLKDKMHWFYICKILFSLHLF